MVETLHEIMNHASARLLSFKHRGLFTGHWDKTQFKADVDQRMHKFLSGELSCRFPDIPIISEEDDESIVLPRPERYFLIDPIDGTASYAHGFPGYVTQLAYIQSERVVCGFVMAPELKEDYVAVIGKGAYLNGRQIWFDPNPNAEVVIDNYPEPRGFAQAIMNRYGITEYVECGSIALKACKVAAGQATVFAKDVPIRDWDIAPASLIVSEAGGYCCDVTGHCLVFDGSYEKTGIIVSRNKKECKKYVKR